MVPMFSTVMLRARTVSSPLLAVTVTPERTVKSPSTTISPSRFLFIVTSRLLSAHLPLEHVPAQVSTVDHEVPATLHSSTDFMLQRRLPAVHAPVHRPAEQA